MVGQSLREELENDRQKKMDELRYQLRKKMTIQETKNKEKKNFKSEKNEYKVEISDLSDCSSSGGDSSGWLSDDEPPKDKFGDLCPLSVEGGGVADIVKRIFQPGTINQAVGTGDDVVIQLIDFHQNENFKNVFSEFETEKFSNLLNESEPMKITLGEYICCDKTPNDIRKIAAVTLACKMMKINESAFIYTSQKGDLKLLSPATAPLKPSESAKLCKLRRRFGKMNSDITNSQDNIKILEEMEPRFLVRLKKVVNASMIIDNEVKKICLKSGRSYLTISSKSILKVVAIKLEKGDSERLVRILTEGEDERVTHLMNEMENTPTITVQMSSLGRNLQDVFSSLKLNECSILSFSNKKLGSEFLQSINFPFSDCEDHFDVLLELQDIKTTKSISIGDPSLSETLATGLSPTENSSTIIQIVDLIDQSLFSHRVKEMGSLKTTTASSVSNSVAYHPIDGSVVVVHLRHPETLESCFISFDIGRHGCVPQWMEGAVKECSLNNSYFKQVTFLESTTTSSFIKNPVNLSTPFDDSSSELKLSLCQVGLGAQLVELASVFEVHCGPIFINQISEDSNKQNICSTAQRSLLQEWIEEDVMNAKYRIEEISKIETKWSKIFDKYFVINSEQKSWTVDFSLVDIIAKESDQWSSSFSVSLSKLIYLISLAQSSAKLKVWGSCSRLATVASDDLRLMINSIFCSSGNDESWKLFKKYKNKNDLIFDEQSKISSLFDNELFSLELFISKYRSLSLLQLQKWLQCLEVIQQTLSKQNKIKNISGDEDALLILNLFEYKSRCQINLSMFSECIATCDEGIQIINSFCESYFESQSKIHQSRSYIQLGVLRNHSKSQVQQSDQKLKDVYSKMFVK